MPNMCTVCRSPNVGEINKALLDGGPLRSIADQWSVSKTALIRHRVHMPKALLKARAAEVLDADNLLAKVRELETSALRIATAAEASQDLRTALVGIRELRGLLELLARLTGKLDGDASGPGGGNRATLIINFPVATPEQLEAVNNAPVIDLPPMARRLLSRPSDGHQR